MARKISAGKSGGESIAGIQGLGPATLTAADDVNIVIDAEGTGVLEIASHAVVKDQGGLRFEESSSNGTNYVAFRAPASISSDLTWTLPASDGSAAQVLTTNGSGTLSWTTAAVTITDNTTDSGSNYVAFTTATSGTITAARVSSSKLTFQPSTGTLSSTELTVNGTARWLLTENVKTTSHTLELADRHKVVAFTGSSAQTVTVPTNAAVAFPVGSVVYIARFGTGTLSIVGSSGVTLTKTGSFANDEEIYIRKRATDSWVVADAPQSLSATGGTISSGGGFTVHTYTSGSSTFVVA